MLSSLGIFFLLSSFEFSDIELSASLIYLSSMNSGVTVVDTFQLVVVVGVASRSLKFYYPAQCGGLGLG